jgi:hypothetical protein
MSFLISLAQDMAAGIIASTAVLGTYYLYCRVFHPERFS